MQGDFSGNRLTGPLPAILPVNLTDLSLGENGFEGPLPAVLPSRVRLFDAHANRLRWAALACACTGLAPGSCALPHGKQYMEGSAVHQTPCSGPLPEYCGGATSCAFGLRPCTTGITHFCSPAHLLLTDPSVPSHLACSGPLPEIAEGSQLQWMDVSSNQLTGAHHPSPGCFALYQCSHWLALHILPCLPQQQHTVPWIHGKLPAPATCIQAPCMPCAYDAPPPACLTNNPLTIPCGSTLNKPQICEQLTPGTLPLSLRMAQQLAVLRINDNMLTGLLVGHKGRAGCGVRAQGSGHVLAGLTCTGLNCSASRMCSSCRINAYMPSRLLVGGACLQGCVWGVHRCVGSA